MESQGARNKILKKIKQALKTPVTVPFPEQVADTPIFIPTEQELAISFAQKFTEKVYSTESGWLDDMSEYQFDPVNTDDLANCDVSITLCEHLVARTGTIVLSSQQLSGRASSVYAPIHICIAYTHQLVYDLADSLVQFKKESEFMPSMISYATGPSRTADIEKTLVVGVHGPKEVYCFLVDKLTD